MALVCSMRCLKSSRIIIPPLTSEFLNVFKNSSVASLIGLMELLAQNCACGPPNATTSASLNVCCNVRKSPQTNLNCSSLDPATITT